MNKKYKLISKILLIIGVISLFVWYFFPYISYKALFYSNEAFYSALALKPDVIDKVQSPPEKWDKISISNLSIQLPLFESVRLSESKDIITFYNNSGSMVVSNIASMNKDIELQYNYYNQQLDTFNSNPLEISIINSRHQNSRILKNHVLKCMSILNLNISNVYITKPPITKMICLEFFNKENKVFIADFEIYNLSGEMIFSLMLKDKNKETFDYRLKNLFSGITIFDEQFNNEIAQRDVLEIFNKYKPRTEQKH